MGTRLRVALVGQATEHRLIKLEPAGTQEALRDLLITRGLHALRTLKFMILVVNARFLILSLI